MEEYLLYMKALRSHMNDVEDQAAKISVEEQMQITTIRTLEKDLDLAHSDIKRLKVETDQMLKTKGDICSLILAKQRKIASLESDSSTLFHTLELIQQEKFSLSSTLLDKRNYYNKVAENINAKLQEQQEWMNSNKLSSTAEEHGLIKDKTGGLTGEAEGKDTFDSFLLAKNVDDAVKNLVTMLDSAKSNLGLAIEKKCNLSLEISKVKQSIELVKYKIHDLKPELETMNVKTLEEELQALLSDRAGETDYLHSLQQQFRKLKGLSHVVKCACGEEYMVEVDNCLDQDSRAVSSA